MFPFLSNRIGLHKPISFRDNDRKLGSHMVRLNNNDIESIDRIMRMMERPDGVAVVCSDGNNHVKLRRADEGRELVYSKDGENFFYVIAKEGRAQKDSDMIYNGYGWNLIQVGNCKKEFVRCIEEMDSIVKNYDLANKF